MSKRFGRVNSYKDWLIPFVVSNYRELIDKELKKLQGRIRRVVMSFMTDPFMYDPGTGDLIPDVKEATYYIIRAVNSCGIPVTTLTKGFYPDDLPVEELHGDNCYGVTLVSLNENFRLHMEPFTAPYEMRLSSLRKVSERGGNTWVCMEPYPTPNIDRTAGEIDTILEKIDFTGTIAFGALNYSKLTEKYKESRLFYGKMSERVREFCRKKGIEFSPH
ncbi:MAG: radical SAM protein [Firmicutes bacterium]|nr:radical SAM protein [Bacillota bacterium]